jgi:hypothetical protein
MIKRLAARNGSAHRTAEKPASSFVHSFEPRDPIEVETPHGLGIVLYITVYGVHGNDMWCVANKKDGRLRHYDTVQLKLAYNGVLGLNKPEA